MALDESTSMRDHIEAMISHANYVLYIANNSADSSLKQRTQKVLAAAVTELDLELLEPVYKAFPELRPVE